MSIQKIKSTDSDAVRIGKTNAAIDGVNEIETTYSGIAGFATSAQAAARIASEARDEARAAADGVGVDLSAIQELRDEAVTARVGAETARSSAQVSATTATAAKNAAAGSASEASASKDAAEEDADAAEISRGAAIAAAAAALLNANAAADARNEAEGFKDAAEAAENSLLKPKGAWVTGVAYKVGEIVRMNGSAYNCLINHTSGTFSTDLAANRWDLFVQQGASGPGSGNMLSSVYDPTGVNASAFTRANHTGTQAISTVSGLQSALDSKSASGHSHAAAVAGGADGFMTGADKTKLNGVAAGATANAGLAQEVWDAEEATTEALISPKKLADYLSAWAAAAGLPTKRYYAEAAISLGALLQFPHGLGAMPKLVNIWFICTTAYGGYAVGDRIPIAQGAFNYNTDGSPAIGVSASMIKVRIANNGMMVSIGLDGGVRRSYPVDKFKCGVEAWA